MALAVAMWSCGGGTWKPALVGIWLYLMALSAVSALGAYGAEV